MGAENECSFLFVICKKGGQSMAEKMGGRGVIGGARQGGGSVAEDSKMDKRGESGREGKEKDSHEGAVLEATKS